MYKFFKYSLPIGIAGIVLNLILYATNLYYELVIPIFENSGIEGAAFKFFDDLVFYSPFIYAGLFAAYLVAGQLYLKKHHLNQIIYSDSVNALSWVRQKVCKSKLPEDASTAELWDYVHRAENWLRTNSYTTEIRKWDTDHWGEIPADFGRK